MMYSILFQNLPAPSKDCRRYILESNQLSDIAVTLIDLDRAILLLLERGTPESQNHARRELARLARLADERVNQLKPE